MTGRYISEEDDREKEGKMKERVNGLTVINQQPLTLFPAVYGEPSRSFEWSFFIQSEGWWRRRDSNPGPKVLHLSFYMLILPFQFSESGAPARGLSFILSP